MGACCYWLCGPFPTGELALVIVDEYSRYPKLEIVTSTSMSAILPKLEKIFAIHRIPDLVKSGNGPPFDSHAFEDYAKEKGFIHKPVTPLWPEANQIERFVQPLVKSEHLLLQVETGKTRFPRLLRIIELHLVLQRMLHHMNC